MRATHPMRRRSSSSRSLRRREVRWRRLGGCTPSRYRHSLLHTRLAGAPHGNPGSIAASCRGSVGAKLSQRATPPAQARVRACRPALRGPVAHPLLHFDKRHESVHGSRHADKHRFCRVDGCSGCPSCESRAGQTKRRCAARQLGWVRASRGHSFLVRARIAQRRGLRHGDLANGQRSDQLAPASTGKASARQRSMPPARLATWVYPAFRSSTVACADRAPERQTVTTGRSR